MDKKCCCAYHGMWCCLLHGPDWQDTPPPPDEPLPEEEPDATSEG